MEKRIINSTKKAVNDLTNLALIGSTKLWVDYDKKADVLYVNFGKPQKADDAKESEEGIIQRKRNNKLIGVTVLNASRFS